jgi:hypothetical protein
VTNFGSREVTVCGKVERLLVNGLRTFSIRKQAWVAPQAARITGNESFLL